MSSLCCSYFFHFFLRTNVVMFFKRLKSSRFLTYAGIAPLIILITTCMIYPIRFPNVKYYNIVPESDVADDLHSCLSISNNISHKKGVKFCSGVPKNITFPQDVLTTVDEDLLKKIAGSLQPGGRWSPSHCTALQKVTIIVPYRDRSKQLKLFLQYMHPFLQSQELDYTITVVEQADTEEFNRGKLLNIGFNEMINDPGICCFIFHDVDLFPESIQNIYGCSHDPRHMSSAIDIFRYVMPYPELFGGVVSFTKSQFKLANGYSNLYFGWGAEDDDLYNRVTYSGMDIARWHWSVSRYQMLSHAKSTPNPLRFKLLANSYERISTDGLNSLKYKVVLHKLEPLYTHYLVDVT